MLACLWKFSVLKILMEVMSSWHYLERLIESIQIYDDTETEDNEKPE